MYTTYHLNSAQDLTDDIIDSIKVAFKSKPIKIIITEDDDNLDEDKIALLEDRMNNDTDFITSEESISYLKKKYDL